MKIDSAKIILLHPGKTGGTSIEHTLRDMYFPKKKLIARESDRDLMFGFDKELKIYLQHACLTTYKRLEIPINEYKTIATIRRPYERILSCYFYNGKSKNFTFEEFVTKDLERCYTVNIEKSYAVNHFSPQYYYTNYNISENYTVDHIIKLENFKEDCKSAGIDVQYHYSRTAGTQKYKNYMDAYNQKTKDIVYSLYKDDFLLLGYNK